MRAVVVNVQRWRAALAAVAAVAVGQAVMAPPVQAAGFLIYDLSGEAIGRASAVSASVNEPAAVWFNPAALAYTEGVQASAGGVLVSAQTRFAPADGSDETNSKRGNFILPTLFASGRISDKVAAGMGVYTAFGIGVRWPDAWPGREAAIAASLQTLAFNPTIAVKLHPRISAAVGFDAIRAVVDFSNGLPQLVGGDVRLAGGTWGYGANAGLLFQVAPELLHLALTYRSRVKLSFDGQADFRPANADFAATLADQPGTAAITLPDIITAGVMGRPRPDLSLTFDVNLVLWNSYDRIDIDFQTAPSRAIVPHGRATFTLRGGVDWAATRWPGLHLRGGLIYDRAAIPKESLGPGLPDANRVDGTVGVGYKRGRFTGDLGYMLVYCLPSDATTGQEGPVGTYYTLAHLLGLTLAVAWP